jgi:DNA-directed RNA polymerase specialized sigma24 family protein
VEGTGVAPTCGPRAATVVATQRDVGERADLWKTLSTLPARQRAALLRYYEDLSERDAAEALGCSLSAVKSLVARAPKRSARHSRPTHPKVMTDERP